MENERPNLDIQIDTLEEINEDMAERVTQHIEAGGTVRIAQRASWQPEEASSVTLDGRSSIAPRAFAVGNADIDKEEYTFDRKMINSEAWVKYAQDAFVGRSVDDLTGRITGEEFSMYSDVYDIQEWMKRIIFDMRNELYSSFSGWVIRKLVESELFLTLTINEKDGFTEVDVVEPGLIDGSDIAEGGIVCHPTKSTMPLYYHIQLVKNGELTGQYVYIPSIYLAYFPELEDEPAIVDLKQRMGRELIPYNSDIITKTKGKLRYNRYIMSWRYGVKEIKRTVSQLRTVFEPLEDFKSAKKWRFEHMKALSSFFIFYQFEDMKSWVRWLALTPEQKRASGLAQVLTSGDRLFVPPGIEPKIQNPQIPSLSGQDEDFLKWIASGLRQPYDVVSSDIAGPTYSSMSSARTPYMDYISDLKAMAKRFFVFDFWKGIFVIKAAFDSKFEYFSRKEVVDFVEGEEVTKYVKYRPEELINVNFPISFNEDVQKLANAFLGSKRGSLTYHLGVSKEEMAKRMGFTNFHYEVCRRATEKLHYPDDILSDDSSIDQLDASMSGQTDMEGKSKTNGTKTKPKPKVKTSPDK